MAAPGPSKPLHVRSSSVSERIKPQRTSSGVALDIARFSDETFYVQEYLQATIQSANEDGVRQFRGSLKDARDSAAADLQRNVYRNYCEFVTISKEISKLEGDLLLLRGLLGQWNEANALFNTDDSDVNGPFYAEASNRLQRSLSSEDDLSDSNRKQAAERMYDMVENLQSVLPTSTTRRLVRDGTKSPMNELAVGSLKFKQAVHMILFNDALVIATKKKSLVGNKPKLIVDRVFGMGEMALLDVRDSQDTTNVFKIMRPSEINVFKAETDDEKRQFISALRKALETYAAAKKGLPGGNGFNKFGFGRQFSATAKQIIIDDRIPPADLKWLLEIPDELDVYIAHREWDEAVDLIMKAKELIPPQDTPRVSQIRSRLDDRIQKLTSLIYAEVSNPRVTKNQVRVGIGRLLKLGLQDDARDVFLETRSRMIRTGIRSIKFDGDIKHYGENLAKCVFGVVHSTADWYSASFTGSDMASAFIVWVKREVEQYSELFRHQVFQTGISFTTIAECIQITVNAAKSSRAIGLDMTFLLSSTFQKDLSASINRHLNDVDRTILSAIQRDKWSLADESHDSEKLALFGDADVDITESCLVLYKCVVDFLNDVMLVMSDELLPVIFSSVHTLFSHYISNLTTAFNNDLRIKPQMGILVNLIFVIEVFFPKIVLQLKEQFNKMAPEVDELITSSKETLTGIKETFAMCRMNRLFGPEVWDFGALDTSENGAIPDNARPSEPVRKLITELQRVVVVIAPFLDLDSMVKLLVEKVFEKLGSAPFWESRKFGSLGIQQFLLDIQFLLRVLDTYTTDQASSTAGELTERALKSYFTANKDSKFVLKNGDWYDERVDACIEELGGEFKEFGAVKS